MFSSNPNSSKSGQKNLVVCHLVEFFFLTLNTCSSFPNNSLTHGFSPTDNCCHRICNKGYKVSKNKEEKIPKTRLMGINICHWLFVMIIFLIQISEIYSKVMSQVCGVNEVGCLLDEDCSSGLFCNTGLAQPRCSHKLFDGCWFQAFCSLELTKFLVNALFAKVHKCSWTIWIEVLWWRIADVRTSTNAMQITSTSTALSIAAITPHAGSDSLPFPRLLLQLF